MANFSFPLICLLRCPLKAVVSILGLLGMTAWGSPAIAASTANQPAKLTCPGAAIAPIPLTATVKHSCDRLSTFDLTTPMSATLSLGSWSREHPVSVDQRPAITSGAAAPAAATESLAETERASENIAQRLDVDADIIEGSPVLQRWLEEVPDLAFDIDHDPAFRTRVRVGYAEFPAADNTGGVYIGVQDVFVGRTPLTLSGEYAVNGQGDSQSFGADVQYYLLPLGWYGNIAPVIGYRHIET
ncbi:MAG: hypothetical protein AAF892_10445, partial [Cyanobacteria bacterium P01_D01_bin.71]